MNIKSTSYTVSVKTGEVIKKTNHRVHRGCTDEGLLGVLSPSELKELKENGFVWTEMKTSFLHVVERYELVEAK